MRRAILLLALPLAVSCRLERRAPVVGADLILRGGAVYTMDPNRPWAEAVAIREGRIVFVGTVEGAQRFAGRGTRILDLPGKMVLPGFIDSHAHPLSGGLELDECNLYDAKTPAEVEGIIRAYAQAHPQLEWIRGNGWQLPVFPRANPTREQLDRAVPDRPAFFWAADGHSGWANSKALALAGITRDTRDPANGRIERDPRTGEPTGTLREAAVGLVTAKMPAYTREARIGAVRRALAEANRFGITGITDADAGEEHVLAYSAVEEDGGLTARVTLALHVDDQAPIAPQVAALTALRQQHERGGRLLLGQAKLYADGVLESRTAALLAPYLDRPGDAGPLVYPPEELAARVAALDLAGFQIHIHAIGDRAIRVSLDALRHAAEANPPRERRPILAHIELFDPADLPRFRREGVIASAQPLWAQADDYITELTEPALGPARSRWLYPLGTLLASGTIVAGGSDWSVSSLNPLEGIQVALTRRAPEAPPGPAWLPQEQARLPEMLAAYTIGSAYAARLERETGSLEVGKLADVIVLDRNLFEIAPTEIHRARVLLTLLGGRTVYRDSSALRPEARVQ
ncbi:MAG: amidohydrolase [Gemmatimonadetes bacterium]|nr:amidohydrolase [Gemmatimonadota bacterium]